MKNFFLFFSLIFAGQSFATQPPAQGKSFPESYQRRVESDSRAFTYKRSLQDVSQRALIARVTAQQLDLASSSENSKLSNDLGKILGATEGELPRTKVSGVRKIPVLMAKFKDTKSAPYPVKNLQTQLFDGPWSQGTMTEYYREVSGNALTVRGTVFEWANLSKNGNEYQGKQYTNSKGLIEYCSGLCESSKVADLIKDLIAMNMTINWGDYDNDGPDNIPNSGDDDGYVDFLAVVQPGSGGECGDNENIWSHRSSLTGWGQKEYKTNSKKKGGGQIAIDDYVIVPALACDKKSMVEIGVFAHEFAHAFGLPDLYDTDDSDGLSAGLGHWCLMASGSWGAERKNPHRPTHMSPWAKEYLGWATFKPLNKDQASFRIDPIETTMSAYTVKISANQYYIINNTKNVGFNSDLQSGIQIWKVNETVVKAGLKNNRVNANNGNRGVMLIEADGAKGLDLFEYPGSPRDLFPGQLTKANFDSSTNPSSLGNFSLCNIEMNEGAALVSFSSSINLCENRAKLSSNQFGLAVSENTLVSQNSSTIEQASAKPDGAVVEISGHFTNSSTNFFKSRDRKFVVVDENGNEIQVKSSPGLVLESSNVPNSKQERNISTYLGKEVIIKGVIENSINGTSIKSQTIQLK